MDPLSILGVAAAVAQFTDIGARLVSAAKETFHSASGATADNLALENFVTSLSNLSDKLRTSVGSPPTWRTSIRAGSAQENSATALLTLSDQCKGDCEKLLAILRKLQVGADERGRGRMWHSIKAGLRTVWTEAKFTEFEKRIDRTQVLMLGHVNSFIWDEISRLSVNINEMKKNNQKAQLDQGLKLDTLTQQIRHLNLDMQIPEDSHEPRILDRLKPADMLDDIRQRFEQICSEKYQLSKQQAILASLNFESRPVRHEIIPEAYSRTFTWIFKSSVAEWMQNGSKIFWISGRAGSGKSTLMKFLADSSISSEPLNRWAQPKPAVVVAHYFWSAGTVMQRSQQGLLQTLLYGIFAKCPGSIPVSCPSRWADADKQVGNARQTTWSVSELRQTLKTLVGCEKLPVKFCFFIDGLDEFDGDHTELCTILEDFSLSPNFKVCVASRALNTFEDSFESYPQLSLHDFTRDDISAFAEDRLRSHPRWAQCSVDETDKSSLIRTISDRANGVFLWVLLVANSLRSGLTNDDDIEELWRRLDVLPTQLESLFKHMLDSVDSVYHTKMAENFLLALEANEPLQLVTYGIQDNEYRDENYAIQWPTAIMKESEMKKLCSRTRRRINARSQGLLEAQNGRVEFLHRTVRDFLRTKEMAEYLHEKARPQFDASFSITKAYVANIKSLDCSSGGIDSGSGVQVSRPVVRNSVGDNTGLLVTYLDECLKHASAVSKQNIRKLSDLLEELERAVELMFSTGQAKFFRGQCHPVALVREMVIRTGCHTYLSHKINIPEENYFSVFDASPLFATLLPSMGHPEMLTFLLDCALDPNKGAETIKWQSPWVLFVFRFSPLAYFRTSVHMFIIALGNRLFTEFLEHGANPNAKHPETNLTVFSVLLLSIFSDKMPLSSGTVSNYLMELKAFLDYGADLTATISAGEELNSSVGYLSHSINEFIGSSQERSVLESFLGCLKDRYRGMNPNRKTLALKTTKTLLHNAKLDTSSRNKIARALAAGFLPETKTSLREDPYVNSASTAQSKRLMEAETDEGTRTARVKTA